MCPWQALFVTVKWCWCVLTSCILYRCGVRNRVRVSVAIARICQLSEKVKRPLALLILQISFYKEVLLPA